MPGVDNDVMKLKDACTVKLEYLSLEDLQSIRGDSDACNTLVADGLGATSCVMLMNLIENDGGGGFTVCSLRTPPGTTWGT